MILRDTPRKRLIAEIFKKRFRDKIAILDELRWEVLKQEAQLQHRPISELTRSIIVSFTRTIRNHMPDYHFFKIHQIDRIPVGIIFKTALNRTKEDFLRNQLINRNNLEVFFNLYGGRVEHDRNWTRLGCIIIRKDNRRIRSQVYFPINQPITIVSKNLISERDLLNYSKTDVPLICGTFFMKRHERTGDFINSTHCILGEHHTSIKISRTS